MQRSSWIPMASLLLVVPRQRAPADAPGCPTVPGRLRRQLCRPRALLGVWSSVRYQPRHVALIESAGNLPSPENRV